MPLFPAVGNADFLAVASDEFLTQAITKGRPGRRMPAWGEKEGGLRPEEISAVVQHLRSLGGPPEPDPKPSRWAQGDLATGQKLYAANCAGCHGADGKGGEALALNNAGLLAAATDTYLFKTIERGRRGTVMPGFAQASTTHPALSAEEIEALVSYIRTWEKKP
jgi:cbb3-type cytochrome c oxidase subunit III